MGEVKYESNLFTTYLLIGPRYNNFISKQIEKGFEVVYDNFKKNSFGITIGEGTETKLLPINLLTEYRYERDLTNNYDSSMINIKNYSQSILVGLKLD